MCCAGYDHLVTMSTSKHEPVAPSTRFSSWMPNRPEIALLIASICTGSLWSIGFLVAPTLFDALPQRALAGDLAGRLFRLQMLATLVACCLVMLLRGLERLLQDAACRWSLLMLLLACVMHFGVLPEVAILRAARLESAAMAEKFGLWHGVSSTLYGVMALVATGWLLALGRGLARDREAAELARVVVTPQA